jgi:hypothetical protein
MQLDGIRVVDLTRILSGPFCTMFLADMGAEVIKVEGPEGELARSIQPRGPQGDSAMFVCNNRNKRSIALDLKAEAGREVFTRLLRWAEVFVHNMRPAALERLHVLLVRARLGQVFVARSLEVELGEALEHLQRLLAGGSLLEVQGQDGLAAPQGVLIAAAELGLHLARLQAGDHRDLGAHVGQHAARQGAGAYALELDDAHTGQRGAQALAHWLSLLAMRSFMISLVPP